MKLLGFFLLAAGVAGSAMASPAVPEIDPSSGLSALALISGALLVIRGSKKR